jgi:hypothetical protein
VRLVLAVDPGLHCGWAAWSSEFSGAAELGEDEQLEFGDRLEAWLMKTSGHERVLVYERFLITIATAKKSQAGYSLEVIGVVKHLARKYGAELAAPQSPADAKGFMTDARLKALGWWSSSDHARDAARHLGLFLVRNGWRDDRLLIEK